MLGRFFKLTDKYTSPPLMLLALWCSLSDSWEFLGFPAALRSAATMTQAPPPGLEPDVGPWAAGAFWRPARHK